MSARTEEGTLAQGVGALCNAVCGGREWVWLCGGMVVSVVVRGDGGECGCVWGW